MSYDGSDALSQLQTTVAENRRNRMQNRQGSMRAMTPSGDVRDRSPSQNDPVTATSPEHSNSSSPKEAEVAAVLFGSMDLVEPYLNFAQLSLLQKTVQKQKQPLHSVLIEVPLSRRNERNEVDRDLQNYKLDKGTVAAKQTGGAAEDSSESLPQGAGDLASGTRYKYTSGNGYYEFNFESQDEGEANVANKSRQLEGKGVREDSVVRSISIFWLQDQLDQSS